MKKCFPLLLALLCLFGMAYAEGDNLLLNPGFEQTDAEGLPADWAVDAYFSQEGVSLYSVTHDAHEGENAARIRSVGENDARFMQIVTVEPETMYRLSGYIRTENVSDSGHGANLSIEGVYIFSKELFATNGWTYVELYGETGPDQTEVTVFARLGGYSGISSGTAYFDDLRLEQVDTLPDGVIAPLWYKPDTAAEEKSADDAFAEDEESTRLPQLLAVAAAYLLFAALLALLRREDRRELKPNRVRWLLGFGLAASALIQFALAYRIDGYPVDVGCFLSWGNTMRTVGASRFYESASFCDYPPGYLPVLGLNSVISQWLKPITDGNGFWATMLRAEVVIKLLPIAANVLAAWLTDRFARKRGMTPAASASVALLLAFSPALMLNSGAWSQIDSVLGLLLLAVVLLAVMGRWAFAFPVYMLAVLVKPQALMFGPLGLAAAVLHGVRGREERKSMLIGIGGAAAVALAVILPFYGTQSAGWLIRKYGETLASYPYATVNTANYDYLFRGNWSPIANTPVWTVSALLALLCALWAVYVWRRNKVSMRWIEIGVACALSVGFTVLSAVGASWGSIGMLAMIAAFALVLPMLFRLGLVRGLPLLGAVLLLLIYSFGTKMHERYLFPALMLFGAAYALHRDRRLLWLLAGCGVTVFLNEGIVLDNALRLGAAGGHLNDTTLIWNNLIAVANVLLAVLGLWTANDICVRGRTDFSLPVRVLDKRTEIPATPDLRWSGKDTLLILTVTALTAVLSLTHLGSATAPQTPWKSTTAEETVTIDLGKQTDAFRLLYFSQISYHPFAVSVSADGETYTEESYADLSEGQIFRWKYAADSFVDANGKRSFSANRTVFSGRYVRIRADQVGLILNEVIFRDLDGNRLDAWVIARTGEDAESPLLSDPAALLDEQSSLSGEPSWYNSTYFDEIYHARTAFEHAHHLTPYETTHPPLGKVLMSWSILLFGMTPFGWRFAGALSGILMVPLMFVVAKQLTKRTSLALLGSLMMALDCMRLTQTRIATIDSFPVLFIMAAFWFMLCFMQRDWGGGLKKPMLDLGFSGLSISLAIASKWIGLYAALGLAALYFWALARAVRKARGNRSFTERVSAVLPSAEILLRFLAYLFLSTLAILALAVTWMLRSDFVRLRETIVVMQLTSTAMCVVGAADHFIRLVYCRKLTVRKSLFSLFFFFADLAAGYAIFVSAAFNDLMSYDDLMSRHVRHTVLCILIALWEGYKMYVLLSGKERLYVTVPSSAIEQLRMLRKVLLLCLWCVFAFVLLPALIYLLSYIPYFSYRQIKNIPEFVQMVIRAQESMFRYHSTPGLGMDHPFYSPWYEWPLMQRPMYYASASFVPSGFSYAIFCFGNPAVWLMGLLGMAYTAWAWVSGHRYRLNGQSCRWHCLRDDGGIALAFVLIGFLVQFLPWVLVPRGTYIYHYFASIPFLCLAALLAFERLLTAFPKAGRVSIGVYLGICALFFLICYPYASGALVPTGWLDLAKKFLNVYYAT